MHFSRLGLLSLLAVLAQLPVLGQSTQDSRDFLFSRPLGSVGGRMGMNLPFANSGIFDLVTDQLTLEKGDFRSFIFGGDISFSIHPRLDLVGGIEYMGSRTPSEVRAYLDENDQPITQETTLKRIPVTGAVKLFLLPKGREFGQYAWTPSRIVPYVGGGGGAVFYQFQQDGEFVDFQDLSIFAEHFSSQGWSPVVFALGGLEFNLTPRLYLDFQLRYEWAENDLEADFRGFDPIDLSGVRATGGLFLRFTKEGL